MPPLFSLTGKVAVVTGGYGLLGRQFVKALGDAGATVVVGGRNLEHCRAVADRYGAFPVLLDVTDSASIAGAMEAVVKEFKTVDCLVNGASHSAPAESGGDNFLPLEKMHPESFYKNLEVDLTGTFNCCRIFGSRMAQQGSGAIVNISSIYGITAPVPEIYRSISNHDRPFVKPPGYGAAKAGIVNLSRYLATYWGRRNVRVNTLTLGGVLDNQDDAFIRRYTERTPLGRMADPSEYNGAVIFLLSDAATYITGTNLVADGGWTAW